MNTEVYTVEKVEEIDGLYIFTDSDYAGEFADACRANHVEIIESTEPLLHADGAQEIIYAEKSSG